MEKNHSNYMVEDLSLCEICYCHPSSQLDASGIQASNLQLQSELIDQEPSVGRRDHKQHFLEVPALETDRVQLSQELIYKQGNEGKVQSLVSFPMLGGSKRH